MLLVGIWVCVGFACGFTGYLVAVCLGVVRLFGGVFSCWLLSNSVFCVWVGLGVFTGVYFGLREHF